MEQYSTMLTRSTQIDNSGISNFIDSLGNAISDPLQGIIFVVSMAIAGICIIGSIVSFRKNQYGKAGIAFVSGIAAAIVGVIGLTGLGSIASDVNPISGTDNGVNEYLN
ncbi:hypothetical protein [Corynebacterium mastitidis]|uniref:hypothetical protein n=1 Tax=Corynebacterium mastitidis TaxID=161890 RepID=UPI00036B5FB4|nr:hypothetical protein [Corynebacterium mastitidis]